MVLGFVDWLFVGFIALLVFAIIGLVVMLRSL